MSEMIKDEVTIGLFDECKRLQAKVEELEERERWIPISAGLKCPSCDDVGWYPVMKSWGQPEGEQEQCEFCYTCPDSVFNRRAELKQEGE